MVLYHLNLCVSDFLNTSCSTICVGDRFNGLGGCVRALATIAGSVWLCLRAKEIPQGSVPSATRTNTWGFQPFWHLCQSDFSPRFSMWPSGRLTTRSTPCVACTRLLIVRSSSVCHARVWCSLSTEGGTRRQEDGRGKELEMMYAASLWVYTLLTKRSAVYGLSVRMVVSDV